MSFVYKLLIEKVLLTYLKGILDKLPGGGFKTIFGLVILVLGVAIQLAPEYAPILQPVIDFLAPYARLITDAGIVTAATGLVHKALKFFKK